MENKKVGKAQLAKELNKSRQYIYDCIKNKKLIFDEDGKIDIEVARKNLEDNTDQSKVRTLKTDDENNNQSINISEIKDSEDFFNKTNILSYQNLQNLKVQMEIYKQWREIELQNRSLLKAEDVQAVLQDNVNLLSTSLEDFPAKICKELATMTDELDIENYIYKKLREIIDEFINQLTMSEANGYS